MTMNGTRKETPIAIVTGIKAVENILFRNCSQNNNEIIATITINK